MCGEPRNHMLNNLGSLCSIWHSWSWNTHQTPPWQIWNQTHSSTMDWILPQEQITKGSNWWSRNWPLKQWPWPLEYPEVVSWDPFYLHYTRHFWDQSARNMEWPTTFMLMTRRFTSHSNLSRRVSRGMHFKTGDWHQSNKQIDDQQLI